MKVLSAESMFLLSVIMLCHRWEKLKAQMIQIRHSALLRGFTDHCGPDSSADRSSCIILSILSSSSLQMPGTHCCAAAIMFFFNFTAGVWSVKADIRPRRRWNNICSRPHTAFPAHTVKRYRTQYRDNTFWTRFSIEKERKKESSYIWGWSRPSKNVCDPFCLFLHLKETF